MPSYRSALPQLGGQLFLTDAGLETSLIFYDGIALPCFAAFPLLDSEEGRRRLTTYFQPFLRLARERGRCPRIAGGATSGPATSGDRRGGHGSA